MEYMEIYLSSHKMMKYAVSHSVNSQNIERGAQILGSRSEATHITYLGTKTSHTPQGLSQ